MQRQLVTIGIVLCATSLFPTPLIAQDDEQPLPEIRWHESWDSALQAASLSHKPIYAFIYARDNPDSQRMWDYTLIDPVVVRELVHFVPCAINAKAAANRHFLQEYDLAPAEQSSQTNTYLGYLAAGLFTDSRGQTLYTTPDFLVPEAMAYLLQQIRILHESLAAIEQDPKHAVAYAQAGHIYLGLSLYQQAEEFLNQALALDPKNEAGAKADAQLDLIILSIPAEDEEQQARQALKARAELEKYLRTYPHSKRELEVRYFIAVCQYTGNRPRQALKTLDYFYGPNKPDEFNENIWTQRALGLRTAIREELGLPPE